MKPQTLPIRAHPYLQPPGHATVPSVSLCAYLCVGEAQTAQVRRHLQAKGTHFLETLHGVIFYFLKSIVFGRVVHFLIHTWSEK